MKQLSLVPVCEKCGGPKSQVKSKDHKAGWRWRCQPCQSALNKQWREQVDWNRIEREKYAADPERRDRIQQRNKGWRTENKEWLQDYAQTPKRKASNRRQAMNSNLKSLYGITIEDYEAKLEQQGGCCAICGATGTWGKRSERLCVDHCHETGRLRDLLCKSCNTGLGCFGDDIGRLLAAAEYLKRHEVGTAAS